MMFGDPQVFAIEATLEPGPLGPVFGNNIAGRIRVWMSGHPVGDFDNEHCWLGPPYQGLVEIPLDELWHSSFEGLACEEIFDRLNFAVFAADRHGSIDTDCCDRSSAEVELEVEQMNQFTFLLNTSEAFDGWKSFLVHPPGSKLMALVLTHGSPGVEVFRFPVEQFRRAVSEFGQWIEIEEQKLMPEFKAEQAARTDGEDDAAQS